MATKFTPKSMARMSQLFEYRTEDELNLFEIGLAKECSLAGVLAEASSEGLTMEQWKIVRNAQDFIRTLVLDAGKD